MRRIAALSGRVRGARLTLGPWLARLAFRARLAFATRCPIGLRLGPRSRRFVAALGLLPVLEGVHGCDQHEHANRAPEALLLGRTCHGAGYGIAMGRPRYRKSAMEGVLVVDKPLGWSSMDVVRRVRKAAGFVKTGHAGTLDPLATGVVVCCIGRATRAVETIMKMPKVYETRVDLAAFTITDDREGPRDEVAVETPPTEAEIMEELGHYAGAVEQAPPQYSAVHVDGERAYKRARKGESVEIPTRTVYVERVTLTKYDWPMLDIEVVCGKGFYVRSLARDLGMSLGTGGHLASLRRTAVGEYTLDSAVTPERLLEPITQMDLLPTPELPRR